MGLGDGSWPAWRQVTGSAGCELRAEGCDDLGGDGRPAMTTRISQNGASNGRGEFFVTVPRAVP